MNAQTDISPIAYHKQMLRQKMLRQRQQYSGEQRADASDAIAQHFMDHPLLAYDAPIAGYRAIRGEVDVMPIFQKVARYRKETCLPKVMSKEAPLAFLRWQLKQPLEKDALGIEQPLADAEEITPQIILIPLLAFDEAGYRLGYGGGFYDRTLMKLRMETLENPPLAIGVAYDFQEVESLPVESHDVRLDGILTETGVSMFI